MVRKTPQSGVSDDVQDFGVGLVALLVVSYLCACAFGDGIVLVIILRSEQYGFAFLCLRLLKIARVSPGLGAAHAGGVSAAFRPAFETERNRS